MRNYLNTVNKATLYFAVPASMVALLAVFAPPGLSFHYLESNALYLMLVYLGLGLILYVVGRPQSMFVSFACCALLCFMLQERSACALGRPEAGAGHRTKVAHFDLDVASLPADSMLAAIARTDADIISLQGLHTEHFSRLHERLITGAYPHFQFSGATPEPPGLIVYSKAPFSYVKKASNAETSSVLGRVQLDQPAAFHFISVYFSPADNVETYAELQRQIHALSFQADQIDAPLLVFGKYSLKPWSRAIQEYKSFTRLRNSRRGLQPTQPHGYLPLWDDLSDHIFYSEHFKCISFETVSCGSEPHLGICGTFEWVNDHEKKLDQRENTEL